jgi:hypothetical protein
MLFKKNDSKSTKYWKYRPQKTKEAQNVVFNLKGRILLLFYRFTVSSRPYAVTSKIAYGKRFSFHLSWNWNIFAGTNTFEHAEFKSEKFPLYIDLQFSHKLQFYLH